MLRGYELRAILLSQGERWRPGKSGVENGRLGELFGVVWDCSDAQADALSKPQFFFDMASTLALQASLNSASCFFRQARRASPAPSRFGQNFCTSSTHGPWAIVAVGISKAANT